MRFLHTVMFMSIETVTKNTCHQEYININIFLYINMMSCVYMYMNGRRD
jgi:hypothetical protein